ncbi:MFS general substrate transporter [Dendrothele bispora CBS 962.96]|uniref:MFS general substrate transporter n=1 Tax=Dendrothele bispora (strain CBS 962.96) TaxID=1314807 RepID=A0A4S8L6Z4_DENBC|nr:MFS general substrate transporter [Dendrothele bispora CBS 962.96]
MNHATNTKDHQVTRSERTPLVQLPHEQQPKTSTGTTNFSSAVLIIPIAVLCRLAIKLPSTTTLYVIHQYICRRHYLSHGVAIPVGDLPDDLCSIPEVERTFSATYTAMTAIDAIGSIIGFSAISFFSSRYGRRPTLIVLFGLGMLANLSLITSRFVRDSWIEIFCLVLWKIFESFSGLPLFIFVITLVVVDTVAAEQRTSSLSRVTGLTNLGGAISFSIGGSLTSHTSNVLPVYFTAATIHGLSLIFVILVLPESLSQAKRDNLQQQQRTELHLHTSAISALHRALEPLKLLTSSTNHSTISGKPNRRLTYCAAHIFLAQIASGYAVVSMLVFLTTRFRYKPADTGYLLTALNLTRTCVLTILIPFLVRSLRPLYQRNQRRSFRHTPLPEDESTNDQEPSATSTDRLDVHLVVISWIIEGLAFILLGQAKTKPGQFSAVMLHGLSAGREPAFRSLVASSVESSHQSQALAAIEMVSSIGTFISPFLMGSILTSTISTVPSLFFWIDGAIVMVAASILLLVRDRDRDGDEQEPNIVSETNEE